MGIISFFEGMRIFYYSEDHEPPHLHIVYDGKESKINLDGTIRENYLPAGKLKILRMWMEKHREELYENWERRKYGRKIMKIKPWSKHE